MRTKVLLGFAALVASALTVVAQPVYSLNVVGYYNVPVSGSAAGSFTMIANQLKTADMTIGTLIPSPPDFTQLYKYTGSGFAISTYLFGAWDDATFTLQPGEGAILNCQTPYTQTFVGEVVQGKTTNDIPAGFSIRSSIVPQAGTLTELGLPTTAFADFDQAYTFDTATQGYKIYTFLFGAWDPAEPTLKVGESMWFQPGAPIKWIRDFTVQ